MIGYQQNYVEMLNKNTMEVVKVFDICATNNKMIAVIFSPNMAAKNNGYGWCRVKIGSLMPLDCVDSNGKFVSKTQKNKIKSMLKLNKAEWVCTDGTAFESSSEDGHTGLDKAIEHQSNIIDSQIE